MVNVAVAGGTGGIGRTIVEELVKHEQHKVFILSRKATTLPTAKTAPVLEVDYSNVEATKKVIQDNGIEVVVSALALFADDAAESQKDLIRAAIQSSTVKRFMPSEYGINYSRPGVLEFHPSAKWWLEAADMLRKSHLDFTRLLMGWLLDHYGFPHCKSHMKPFKFAMDFENRQAALPGDGKSTVTFLHSVDIAKYVAALIEEKKRWPEYSAFSSDRMTWNDFIALAEEVMGEKWTVSYEPEEKLERGVATLFKQPKESYELPEELARGMVAEYGIMSIRGLLDVTNEGIRNDEFPEVKPITVRALVEEAWGKSKQ